MLHKKDRESLINTPLKTGLPLSTDELLQYICHLERRQVRLQLMNEELLLAKEEVLKIADEKFAELYQSATTGYLPASKYNEIFYDDFGKPIDYRFVDAKRKQAEKALKESELKFRTVADQTFDWVYWMGEDQQIIYMSPACKNITGYDPEEFISNPQLLQKIVHPVDYDTILRHNQQIFLAENRNEVYDLETRIISKEGARVWISHICRPIFDENGKYLGRRICNRDITERKESEKQLKLLSRAIEQSPITVVITDKKGNIQYVNPKFTEQTGYEFEEVKGKNPRLFQSGEQSVKFYEELWNTIMSGYVWHGEFHNKKKSGESYWESTVISTILNSKGEISFFLAVKEDITEKKRMMADLVQAKEKAEESDRLKSSFLANMSHEIRTPMNGIMGFAELLKEPNLSGDEQQEYIHIIQKSGTRMLNIINDIISISKVESGQMDVYITDTNINKQIDYLYTFFKPEAEQKGLQLFFKKPLSSKEATLKTDKEKVYAILTNLVKNAIKFTPAGSIEFGYERKDKFLEFFVKDTGPGILEEQRKFIFERFRQGSESLNRNYEGAGLGLTISKAFVEMLGGEIWVKSSEGKGSEFYFTIPYTVKTNEKKRSRNTVSVDEAEYPIKKLKILIAEDDKISSVLLGKVVRNFSKEVLIVKNGIEAVEACCDNPDIDLILMDIKMPLLDGYEATRLIRKFNTDVVIIAQSAFALTGDQDKAITAGCNDYLTKPIIRKELMDHLNKYFNRQLRGHVEGDHSHVEGDRGHVEGDHGHVEGDRGHV